MLRAFQMSPREVSYDSVWTLLQAFLKASSPVEEEKCFSPLADGAKYIDFTSYLLRCLQSAITEANFTKTDVGVFYGRVVRLLEALLPMKMPKEFMGEPPAAKSDQAKRMRLPTLRHMLTDTWSKLFEKELPDDLMLDSLMRLGDGQLDKMTDTARLLAPYVTTVFDPPSPDVPPSWSRAVSRAILKVIHLGGLNFDRLYPRLYQLLDDSLLTCPHADRFLVDLDDFLSSIHLPAGWVAAFAKRLAQLTVQGASLWLLPPLLTVVANCLIRHPMSRVLVDRKSSSVDSKRRRLEDGANEEEHDEAEADECSGDPYTWRPNSLADDAPDALKSSLWELACLEKHYHPEVASLALRVRQIAGSTKPDHLPDLKNQVRLGKNVLESSKKKACQYLSVLQMTNARIPSLSTLEGWTSNSEKEVRNTA
uniref:CBF domain-containing protein n=1 Tax=Mesocestoides corti TaxID=53468 RepID=A0A5K3FLW1_MESCO